MTFFKQQEEFMRRAEEWLGAADAEYRQAWDGFHDPAQSWAKSVHRRRMIDAHAKRGYINAGSTGSGKTRPAQALAIKHGRESKRPSLMLTTSSLIGTNILELLEAGRDDERVRLHPLQVVPIQGSPAQKLEALQRVRSLSGKSYVYVVANPEALLPPKDAALEMAKPTPRDSEDAVARLPSALDDADDEENLSGDEAVTQRQVWELFRQMHWSCVVCDEFQRYISSTTTRVARYVFAELRADWRIGLSATAFPYKPKQFANAVNFFQPGRFWPSTASFVRDNFILDGDRAKRVLPGWEPLYKRLSTELLYSYDLDDVVELPPVTFLQERVDLSDDQRRIYNGLKKDFIEWMDAEIDKSGMSRLPVSCVLARLLRLKQVCVDLRLIQGAVAKAKPGDWLRGLSWERQEGKTSPKIDFIAHSFTHDLYENERACVFTQWSTSAELVATDFAHMGIKSDVITGKVSSKVTVHSEGITSPRLQKCHGLNYGDTEILVFNESAAEGLNLQRANHIYILDLPYRYDKLAQAIGRIRRPVPADMLPAMGGSPLPVSVHLLIAPGTLEETMLLPRLLMAGRAAGMFTHGRDLLDTPEAAMFTGSEDGDLGSLMDRNTLIAGI